VQSDGKSVVVGRANEQWAVVRYNDDGSLDPTFGFGGKAVAGVSGGGSLQAVAIQGDGKIVVTGMEGSDPYVVRYLPNGQFDAAFNSGGTVPGLKRVSLGAEGQARDVAVQADGKILVLGDGFTGTWDYDRDFIVARLLPDGSADHTFGNPAGIPTAPQYRTGRAIVGFGDNEYADALAIDYNGSAASNPHYGKILIAGKTKQYTDSTDARFAVARLNADGTPDEGFDHDGRVVTEFGGDNVSVARGVTALPGGRVVAVGGGGTGETPSHFALAAYRSDGSLDPGFGPGGDGRNITFLPGPAVAEDVVVGHGGKLLVGGSSNGDFSLVRFNPNGIIDFSFGQNGRVFTDFGSSEGASAIALAPGGKVVAAGTVTPDFPPGPADFGVARYFDVAPNVAIESLDTYAVEGEGNPASFVVTRDVNVPFATRVYFTIGGTASSRSPGRYTPADFVTSRGTLRYVDIPAGESFTVVTVTATADNVVEGTETAVFTLVPAGDGAYEVNAAHAGVTIRIADAPLVFTAGLTSGTSAVFSTTDHTIAEEVLGTGAAAGAPA
jgi:uncharacterized delta-60 repeat protein